MIAETVLPDSRSVSGPIRESAEKLERHIRACGLKPGDRYISAEQGSRLLGASITTTQRAMAFLARQNILERRPKAGTFIGGAVAQKTPANCIHILLPDYFMSEDHSRESYWGEVPGHIQGMRSVLQGLSVQFNFIPKQDLGYVRQIVEHATGTGPLVGAVLILPSRPIRAFFNQSGIPTVVEGGVEADLTNLCWVQWDQAQTGRLLASYLIERGHRRIVTIMRDLWSIGEHVLHDEISEVITAAGLSSNALRIRSAPLEHSAIAEVVRSVLTEDAVERTGFICRNEFQAKCVAETAERMGMAKRVEVAMCNASGHPESLKYTCVVPDVGAFEFGKAIGGMFQSMIQNRMPEPRGRNVAVKLRAAGASS